MYLAFFALTVSFNRTTCFVDSNVNTMSGWSEVVVVFSGNGTAFLGQIRADSPLMPLLSSFDEGDGLFGYMLMV